MKTFEDVAKKVNLSPETTKRYCAYMRTRWGSDEWRMTKDSYALEWAERFKSGYKYQAADSIGRSVLNSIKTEM